jgi:hypothetical protein
MQPKPRYPEFKPSSLADRGQITPFFYRSPPVTSELTCTNIFVWRTYDNLRWWIGENRLLIIGDVLSPLPLHCHGLVRGLFC